MAFELTTTPRREYQQLYRELNAYLSEATERIIREEVFGNVHEAGEKARGNGEERCTATRVSRASPNHPFRCALAQNTAKRSCRDLRFFCAQSPYQSLRQGGGRT